MARKEELCHHQAKLSCFNRFSPYLNFIKPRVELTLINHLAKKISTFFFKKKGLKLTNY